MRAIRDEIASVRISDDIHIQWSIRPNRKRESRDFQIQGITSIRISLYVHDRHMQLSLDHNGVLCARKPQPSVKFSIRSTQRDKFCFFKGIALKLNGRREASD